MLECALSGNAACCRDDESMKQNQPDICVPALSAKPAAKAVLRGAVWLDAPHRGGGTPS
jgi:hypothetical protein